jgi:hypothetical protein
MNHDDAGPAALLVGDLLMQFTKLLAPPWIEARRFVERYPALMSDAVLDLLAEMLASAKRTADLTEWNSEVY